MRLETPMAPPGWALLERELLRANARACEEFFDRYFDDRGYLECVERWGGDDGPDDAIENVNDWPVLYALGRRRLDPDAVQEGLGRPPPPVHRGPDDRRAVRTRRDVLQGIPRHVRLAAPWRGAVRSSTSRACAIPQDPQYRQRVTRFAGFYLNDDPGRAELRPEGTRSSAACSTAAAAPCSARRRPSTGPATRSRSRTDSGSATASTATQQMLEHFKDYNDIVGDHPQNLGATTLALNAYMLTHDERYKTWILDYVERLAPADDRQRRDHPDQHRPRRQDRRRLRRQVVRRRLRLGIHRHRSRRRERPVNRNDHTWRLNGFGNAYPPHRRRPLPRRLAQADRRGQFALASRKAAGRSTRTCTATRAGTTTGPSRTGTACWSFTTGR